MRIMEKMKQWKGVFGPRAITHLKYTGQGLFAGQEADEERPGRVRVSGTEGGRRALWTEALKLGMTGGFVGQQEVQHG